MKLSHKLHLWLSIPFGIFISLICFSGAMLIFEDEITRAMKPEVYSVEPLESGTLPLDMLTAKVDSALGGERRVTQLTIYPESTRAWRAALDKPKRAAVFVNPYTGEITGEYARLPFFATMIKLHRTMLDSAGAHGDGFLVGKNIVGYSTLVLLVALITGLIMWLRALVHNPRRSLSIPLKHGAFAFMRGLHNAGGTYAFIVLIAIAVTGLTWSFGWFRTAFYTAAGTGLPISKTLMGLHRTIELSEAPDRSQWQSVYDQLREANPNATEVTLTDADATVGFGGYGNLRKSDLYTFDTAGNIQLAESYEEQAAAIRLRGWVYSVHIGAVGGIATRIIWFVIALLGATLPLTGYYLWIHRLRKARKPRAESRRQAE